MDDHAFRQFVLRHYRSRGRHDLPWRATTDPYRILVSEIMLQQTQVSRVTPFYQKFLRAFPSFRVLARATPSAVLKVWQGLGYNRRALMLQRCAKVVTDSYVGSLPRDYESLRTLPGIGPYTAGAVMAFAFDMPVPVIETNIRRVYLHHFFPGKVRVPDEKIAPLVERHLAHVRSPRTWYSALMDYGSWLAAQVPNPNIRSKHYARQAAFEGSNRQLRGAIVRILTEHPRLVVSRIAALTDMPADSIASVMPALEREGFVVRCTHAWCVHNPHWALR